MSTAAFLANLAAAIIWAVNAITFPASSWVFAAAILLVPFHLWLAYVHWRAA